MSDSIDLIITGRRRDLGDGFEVGRVLPFAKRRMVGPFIFFDHMGPAVFAPGHGLDVRPHPHIGLATVTYLFDGEIMHRDSLGSIQAIRPGDVNWMVAGHAIAHSERSAPDIRAAGQTLHGIQSWVALPREHEDTAASFAHHPAATLPVIERPGVTMRVIAGHAFGERSPAKVFSDTLYVDVAIDAGATLDLPPEHAERAVYVAMGQVTIDGQTIDATNMAVLKPEQIVRLTATQASRLMLLGGAAADGPRHIWWNLVSSDEARIEQAKTDWANAAAENWQGRFRMPPEESEFIPLPTS